MAAVHSQPLPAHLDSLSSAFSRIALGRKATEPPIVDAEAIKKAIFDSPYEPSQQIWTQDQQNYVKTADDPLPEGYPEQVVGRHVWDGKQLIKKPKEWLHVFSKEEIKDVDKAIEHFLSLNLPFGDISRETFPLTVLKPALDQAVDEIFNGLGLRIFRGLPVQKWDRKSQIIAFAGISAYIGQHRYRQIGTAGAINHLRDLTARDPGERPPIVVKGQTNGNQVFHTDAGDIIGLLTLGRAEKGGLSQLASVGQFYNTLAESRRDILRTLAKKDWYTANDPSGSSIIDYVDNRVIAQYGRRPFFEFFEAKGLPEGIPPIRKEQHLALDALHFTAESASLDIDLQPGDLEYVNNITTFHARTSSEDSEDNIRHLLRIWFRNEQHQTAHGETFEKRWVGLVKLEEQHPVEAWPLEAWDVVRP